MLPNGLEILSKSEFNCSDFILRWPNLWRNERVSLEVLSVEGEEDCLPIDELITVELELLELEWM